MSKHEEVNLKKYSSSVCILMPGENSLEFTRLSQGKDILWGKDFEEAMQGKAEKAIHVLQQYHRPIGWDVISAIIIANAADPILQNSVDYWLEKRQLSLHRMALRHEGLARIIFTTGLAKQVTGEELGALVKKHSQLYRELAESGQLDSNAILDRRLHLQISEKIQNDSVLGKKPVVITHVQMVHDAISEDFYSIWEASEDKNIINLKLKEEVAYSQFKVAQLILKNPQKVIVLEGLDHKITSDEQDIVSKETTDDIRANFPNGIPECFNKLSDVQKDLLRVNTAPVVLLCLNKIPVVYPSTTPELAKKLYTAIDEATSRGNLLGELKKIESDFRPEREQSAIASCLAAARESENFEVFLVFGGLHKFYQYQPEDNSYYMTPPENMDASDLLTRESKMSVNSDTINPFLNGEDFVSKFKKEIANFKLVDINLDENKQFKLD
ncbi:hypothetical protein OQJ15_05490 [Fluoribacter dumoffii]|uniref:hypothetical protein n=1 Tax=Fluoribacter dumoffii TaxID=463 RepID=UPI00224303A5|nr:hypothetical protein [Fluoribacter dumoffii]MCW8385761.1 hypothetical protein [Fluoribacter dumoffii]MCW8495944.1 hypothetical protein [Fluoribacter dumoffii]